MNMSEKKKQNVAVLAHDVIVNYIERSDDNMDKLLDKAKESDGNIKLITPESAMCNALMVAKKIDGVRLKKFVDIVEIVNVLDMLMKERRNLSG